MKVMKIFSIIHYNIQLLLVIVITIINYCKLITVIEITLIISMKMKIIIFKIRLVKST